MSMMGTRVHEETNAGFFEFDPFELVSILFAALILNSIFRFSVPITKKNHCKLNLPH
jgi:hypothetical protein